MADQQGGAGALTYDPGADAAARYPDWVIRHRSLGGIPEVLCRRRRVILINNAHTWPAKRSSLAHAVAHLDLGHATTASAYFEKREEKNADQLAARRLISLDALAEVLCWTRDYGEIADELLVDVAMLKVREKHMHVAERHYLRRIVRPMEEIA
jgi:Zn-dependent peptidase ImmA (M78 family)